MDYLLKCPKCNYTYTVQQKADEIRERTYQHMKKVIESSKEIK